MRPLDDGSVVVGLFNRTGAAAEVLFLKSALPANLSGKGRSVRDLWEHVPVEVRGESFKAVVPTHGVALLKIGVR